MLDPDLFTPPRMVEAREGLRVRRPGRLEWEEEDWVWDWGWKGKMRETGRPKPIPRNIRLAELIFQKPCDLNYSLHSPQPAWKD